MFVLSNKDEFFVGPDQFSSAPPRMFTTIEDALLCIEYLRMVGSCESYEIGTYNHGKYKVVKSEQGKVDGEFRKMRKKLIGSL